MHAAAAASAAAAAAAATLGGAGWPQSLRRDSRPEHVLCLCIATGAGLHVKQGSGGPCIPWSPALPELLLPTPTPTLAPFFSVCL